MADEPTGNLDTATSETVLELLADLHRTGTTVVLVAHPPEIATGAQRRLVVRDGLIVTDTDGGGTGALNGAVSTPPRLPARHPDDAIAAAETGLPAVVDGTASAFAADVDLVRDAVQTERDGLGGLISVDVVDHVDDDSLSRRCASRAVRWG